MDAETKRNLVTHARQLMPTLKKSAEVIKQRAETGGEDGLESALTGDVEVSPATEVSSEQFDQIRRARRETLLRKGANAVEKITRGQENALDRDEEDGLEAIVLVSGRPAIRLDQGTFPDQEDPWTILNGQRERIETQARSVGRIELQGNPMYPYGGTGFVVADSVIMTNRHVAVIFSERDGSDWRFYSWMNAGMNITDNPGGGWPAAFKVTETIGIHDKVDMALLRIEPASGAALPEPLKLSSGPPAGEQGHQVYALGYPAKDPTRNDPTVMHDIFGDIYNVKRLQPGAIMALVPEQTRFQHDCSTLGGNSGSLVADLQTHKIIGLHFKGKYLQYNDAIALWQLGGDALMKKANIQLM